MSDANYHFKQLEIEKTCDKSVIDRSYKRLSLKYHNEQINYNDFNTITNSYMYLLDYIKNIDTNFNSNTNSNNNNTNSSNNNTNSNTNNTNSSDKNSVNKDFELILSNHNFKDNTSNNIINNAILDNYDIEYVVYITFKQSYTGCNIPITINKKIYINNVSKFQIETIYVKINRGIDDNEIIVLKEKGNVINNKAYDVNVKVLLIPDNDFIRSGLDLIYKKTLTLKESLVGFEFVINHLNGKQYKITNRKITPHNHIQTIKDRGFIRDEYYGDLLIMFNIIYPEYLSDETIKTITEIL